jgi:hypothetical protein
LIPIYPLDGGQIVFNLMTCFLRETVAAKVSLCLGAVLACGYVLWDAQQYGGLDHYLVIMFGFLLFNAYRYLR